MLKLTEGEFERLQKAAIVAYGGTLTTILREETSNANQIPIECEWDRRPLKGSHLEIYSRYELVKEIDNLHWRNIDPKVGWMWGSDVIDHLGGYMLKYRPVANYAKEASPALKWLWKHGDKRQSNAALRQLAMFLIEDGLKPDDINLTIAEAAEVLWGTDPPQLQASQKP